MVRALKGISPWAYVIFGLLALVMVILALLPNLKRLKEGNERRVQLIARVLRKGQFSKKQEP
jgi:hypothetical protein